MQITLHSISPLHLPIITQSSYTWEWIRDGVGLTNIIDVRLTGLDIDVSTVTFELAHIGTLHTGFNWHTSLGNSGTWPPQPFGG